MTPATNIVQVLARTSESSTEIAVASYSETHIDPTITEKPKNIIASCKIDFFPIFPSPFFIPDVLSLFVGISQLHSMEKKEALPMWKRWSPVVVAPRVTTSTCILKDAVNGLKAAKTAFQRQSKAFESFWRATRWVGTSFTLVPFQHFTVVNQCVTAAATVCTKSLSCCKTSIVGGPWHKSSTLHTVAGPFLFPSPST